VTQSENTQRRLNNDSFQLPKQKVLKESIGKPLDYIETSMFGPEYKTNGRLTGANRPHITGKGREFFANVTMRDGLIERVE
jgi:hypothetical protein